MPAKSKLKVTPSSGNVFRDLGFSEEEAEHLVIRADLLIQIQKVVTARRLKQAPLAKLLQVSQPRVSDLLRGRLHLFSIETLIDMLGRLGVQVRFVVKPTRQATSRLAPRGALGHVTAVQKRRPASAGHSSGFAVSRAKPA